MVLLKRTLVLSGALGSSADRGRRHTVPDETREARVCRLREVPAVRFGSRPVLARIEAVGRDLRVHLRRGVLRHQGVRDGRGNTGVRGMFSESTAAATTLLTSACV